MTADASDYEFLFDGSEPGWVLDRTIERRERLTVVFRPGGPVRGDLRAMRAAIPALAAEPAQEFVARVRGRTELDLGDFRESLAHQIRAQCVDSGVHIRAEAFEVVHWRFFNESSDTALVVDDAEQMSRLRARAELLGTPIRDFILG